MLKIVVLDGEAANPGDLSWDKIGELGELIVYENTLDSEIVERSKTADIIIVNKVNITHQVFNQLPALKCICLLSTGYNNIDLKAAANHDITVCNAVGYASPSVAQHVFALILSIINQVYKTSNGVHKGDWARSNKWTYTNSAITELSGKILGIYGLGKIGMAVAQVGIGFGMRIIANKKNMNVNIPNIQLCEFETLLKESDVLSLHAPLSIENEFIINKSSLEKMKSSAILINTGRGGLINELDLKDALINGRIRAAGLDVLSEEPPQRDHILMGVENCLITPHQAWAAVESRRRLLDIVCNNIKAFQAGLPINIVKS